METIEIKGNEKDTHNVFKKSRKTSGDFRVLKVYPKELIDSDKATVGLVLARAGIPKLIARLSNAFLETSGNQNIDLTIHKNTKNDDGYRTTTTWMGE